MVLCTATLLVLKPENGKSQVTGYGQANVVDTLGPQCSFPAFRNFYFWLNINGTFVVTDSMTVHINWGDATDTTLRERIYSPFGLQIYHNYYSPGTYGAQVTLVPDNGPTDTIYGVEHVLSDSCGNLSGRLYVDNNNNCIYDAGDAPHAFECVKITNVNNNDVFYTFTDASGMYYMSVPTNETYSIQDAYIYGGYTPSCPLSGIQTVTVAQGNYVEDFAYSCANAANIDMSVGAGVLNYRPGADRYTDIWALTDNLCTTIPATVTLTLDPLLSYAFTVYGPPPDNIAGNVLTWNVAALGNYPHMASNLYLHASNAATLGDTLCSTLTVTTAAPITDPNMANNTYHICAPVVAACDPNEKDVWPKGVGAQGYIANGTQLHYTLEFQNTGTDTAYNITIVDTLDNDLDVNTIHIEKSGFMPKVSIVNGHILVFKLDHVMLPDSGVNLDASIGSVSFSIKPKASLAQGTQIQDKAYIYFDFNAPVATNAPLNTINDYLSVAQSPVKAKASVYPNPSDKQFVVMAEGAVEVAVYDMLGRLVDSQVGMDKLIFNTQFMSNGIYTVKIKTVAGEQATKVSVQH